jgi:two-component system response regulator YesN
MPNNRLIELGLRLVRLGLERDDSHGAPTIALIADIDDFLVHCASQGPGYSEGACDRVHRAIEQLLAESWGDAALLFSFELDEFAVLLAIDEQTPDALALAYQLAEEIVAGVRQETGFTVGIGVGGLHPEAGGIARSFEEAAWALRHKVVLGGNRVFSYQALHNQHDPPTGSSDPNLDAAAEELWRSLRQGDAPQVQCHLQSWLRMITMRREASPERLEIQVAEMLLQSLQVMRESGIEPMSSQVTMRHMHEMRTLPTIHEFSYLAQRLEAYFQELTNLVVHTDRAAHDPVGRARTIIHERFAESLSLASIANEIYVSSYYLSHLFRRSLGVTFLDYLTNYRLQQARQLLERSQCSIEVVAQQVGYADTRHFSKLFKRKIGISPSQYRLRRTSMT